MPLYAALSASAARIGFHMPGHAGGKAFSASFRGAFSRLDNTEISVLDDLNNPSGPVLESETLTASLFGAARTHYVTTGSTTSLKVAIAAAVPAGGTLLLSRTVHKSIAHAIAELDLHVMFLPLAETFDHPLPIPVLPNEGKGIDPFDALLITSPDYYGYLLDVDVFAAYAHAAGACLIVDAAHGSHLLVDSQLCEKRAIVAGADLVIESAHKTLAALTPGSYLHISKDAVARERVEPARVAAMLRVYQTSSPSFPIAASLEYAAFALAIEGKALWRARLEDIARFEARLPNQYKLVQTMPADRLRVVIDVSKSHHTAKQIELELVGRGIDIEMCGFSRLLLIVSLWQDPADFDELQEALSDIACMPPGRKDDDSVWADRLADLLRYPPQLDIHPRQAMFGRMARRFVSISNAVGSIAAEAITPTPPCIPLVWPGERISREQADLCEAVLVPGTLVSVLEKSGRR